MKTLKEAKELLSRQLEGINTDKEINQTLHAEIYVKNVFIHHYRDLHKKGSGETAHKRTLTLETKLIKVISGFAVISMKHIIQDNLKYQFEEDVKEVDKGVLHQMVGYALDYWKNYSLIKSLNGIILETKSQYEKVLKGREFKNKSFRVIFYNLKDGKKTIYPSYVFTNSEKALKMINSMISIFGEKASIQKDFITCEIEYNENRKKELNIENYDFYYENEEFRIEMGEDAIRFVSKKDNEVDVYPYGSKNVLGTHLEAIKERNQVTNLIDKPVFHTMKFFEQALNRVNVSEEKAKDIVQFTDDIVGNGKTEEEMMKMLSIYLDNERHIKNKNIYRLEKMKYMHDTENFVLMRFDTDCYYWFVLGNRQSAHDVFIYPSQEKIMPEMMQKEMLNIINSYINN